MRKLPEIRIEFPGNENNNQFLDQSSGIKFRGYSFKGTHTSYIFFTAILNKERLNYWKIDLRENLEKILLRSGITGNIIVTIDNDWKVKIPLDVCSRRDKIEDILTISELVLSKELDFRYEPRQDETGLTLTWKCSLSGHDSCFISVSAKQAIIGNDGTKIMPINRIQISFIDDLESEALNHFNYCDMPLMNYIVSEFYNRLTLACCILWAEFEKFREHVSGTISQPEFTTLSQNYELCFDKYYRIGGGLGVLLVRKTEDEYKPGKQTCWYKEGLEDISDLSDYLTNYINCLRERWLTQE